MSLVKTPGQLAYERDLLRAPTYADGMPRPPWEQLRTAAQWSWERNPTDRVLPNTVTPANPQIQPAPANAHPMEKK
jgi:hypothetical protein